MRISSGVVVVSGALLLSGCVGVPTSNTVQTTSVQGATLRGVVYGGQSPISQAHVYLYGLNTTNYGGPGIPASSNNASISLLNSSVLSQTPAGGFDGTNYYVTTDSNGSFTVSPNSTYDYTCPTIPGMYFYAVGGNPGLAPGTNNTAATLMAPVGCKDTAYKVVNEVSTIATAYAFAGFATDPLHVGSSGSTLAVTALGNAGGTLKNLYTPSTGVASTATAGNNGTVPTAEINTLANILAACVNTSGSTATGQPCNTLFTNALSGGTTGTQPTDTATAAVNIAHNPGANVATLFTLQSGSPPFPADLGSAPNDFTIAVKYAGGALSSPEALAVDGSGNVWVANTNGVSLSEFSPAGAVLSGTTGYTGGGLDDPTAVAIDGSGYAWAVNYGSNGLSEFNSSGVPQSGSGGFTGGGMASPYGVAIDASSPSSHVWVANDSTDLSEFDSSGSPVSSGYTGGGVNGSHSVAIDASGNVWTANNGNNSLSEFNSKGVAQSGSAGYTLGGLSQPWHIAIDGSGYAWATNQGNNSLSKFSSSGTPISSSSGYTGGGLDNPWDLAIDGSGNVWVANETGNSISEFNSSGAAITGSNGYEAGSLSAPCGIAIDGSGDVWVSNDSGNTITEFVGAATPVVTPKVANLLPPYAVNGSTVNEP